MLEKIIFRTLLILAILTLAFVSYRLYETYKEKDLALPLDKISGSLLYTLSPESDHTANIYTYNLETGEEKEIVPNDRENIKFAPSMSPDGRYFAYTAAPYDFSSKLLFPHTEKLALTIYDSVTGEIMKTSTSTSAFRNKKPRWSPNGKYILYHGYSYEAWEKNATVKEPDNWIIYLYNVETKETKEMANGTEAIWSNNGEDFYYIKNDGLHVKNIVTNVDKIAKKVISVSGENQNPKADMAMSIGLSPDGSKIAWATPHSHEFVIYDIDKNDPTLLTKIRRFSTGEAEVFTPVFSPDGKFIVVQETELHINGLYAKASSTDQLYLPELTLTNPRITIYELENFKSKKIKDLSGFDFYGTTVTQWIK